LSWLDKNLEVFKARFESALLAPIKRNQRTLFRDNLPSRKVIHCGHHKVGTYWFARILNGIAEHYGLKFQNCEQFYLENDTDIFMEQHSYVDLTEFDDYIGSHLIRDPRDMVVSGFHYHKWTDEDWAHLPQPSLGFQSFQKYLNSLNDSDGLLAEITRTAKNVNDMADWNYRNPKFFEIKYEELVLDEMAIFEQLFKHFGFNEEGVRIGLLMAEKYSFKNVTKRKVGQEATKNHLRSGKVGQWKEIFTEDHKALFKELTGDSLIKMGYEQNQNW
jgi:hypothetical protein